MADDKGGLVRIPRLPPEKNERRRQIDLMLLANGNIEAKMEENSIGQAAAVVRGELRSDSPAAFVKRIEYWISQTVPGAAITKVTPAQIPDEDRFVLHAEFQGPNFAQIMNDRLMVFVDDLPDAVKLETSFGSYSSGFETMNDVLVFTRRLSLTSSVLPVERYPEVRSFFQRMSTSDQSPVVLVKN